MSVRRAIGTARVIGIVAAVCAAAGGAAALMWFGKPAVTVTRVIEGPVVEAFYATGTVRPRIEYPINSGASGIVERVLVRQGDAVRRDQVLAVVDDPQLRFQADKAAADLKTRQLFADPEHSPVLHEFDQRIAAAGQMLEVAKQMEQRFVSLATKNAASANDRDQAHEHAQKLWADLESLEAQRSAKLRELGEDVEVAESADRAAREGLRRQTLRSPVDGVVLDEPIARGTRVEVNAHVMQIADVRPANLVMRAAVDEENIARAADGQPARMTLYSFPARAFEGTIERKYPKADATRRTFDVDVRFADPDPRLQPGMTGELAFIEKTVDRGLIVPAQAVQGGAVWCVRDGRLVKVDAVIGVRSTERAQILDGVHPGDFVLLSPVGELRDGQAVRVGSSLDPKVAADLNQPKESEFKGFQ